MMSQCASPANKPRREQQPASRHVSAGTVETPRQRQREADCADQRAVEERRVRTVAGQLARQQLVERIARGRADQQQNRWMQDRGSRSQQHQDAGESGEGGDPARARRPFAEHRQREHDDEDRREKRDRRAFGQRQVAQAGEEADGGGQQERRAEELHPQIARAPEARPGAMPDEGRDDQHLSRRSVPRRRETARGPAPGISPSCRGRSGTVRPGGTAEAPGGEDARCVACASK